MNEQISTIETSRIVANPNNPRTRIEDVSDLVASIRENGLMQPIIVRWTKQKDESGIPTGYEVIAGSRRLTACQQLGIKKINCIVMTCDDDKAFELATVENLVRENMTPADEARAVAKLFKEGKGRIEVGAIFGKSGRWAEGRRRIANLGEKALDMLEKGKITLGHAEVLCLCDEDRVERWLSDCTWRKPEELKRSILALDRKLLSKSPFNWKKQCEKCPKRSDCQSDLFGDVEDVYCLDEECFDKQIKKECIRIIKEFKKAGYEAVPEEKLYEAKYGWHPFIDASSKSELDIKKIESLKKNGAKAMFWVDEHDASSGLVFMKEEIIESNSDDEEDEDETLAPELEDIEAYEDRESIHDIANNLENEDIKEAIESYLRPLGQDVVLTLFNALCPANKHNEEKHRTVYTFAKDINFKYTEENDRNKNTHGMGVLEALTKTLAGHIDSNSNSYKGIDDFWREKFSLEDRGHYLTIAKEKWQNETDIEEETSDEEENSDEE